LQNSKLAFVEAGSKGKGDVTEVHRRYAWSDFPDGNCPHVFITVLRWDESVARDEDTAYAGEVLLEVRYESAGME